MERCGRAYAPVPPGRCEKTKQATSKSTGKGTERGPIVGFMASFAAEEQI
jgi:hypothetical protein